MRLIREYSRPSRLLVHIKKSRRELELADICAILCLIGNEAVELLNFFSESAGFKPALSEQSVLSLKTLPLCPDRRTWRRLALGRESTSRAFIITISVWSGCDLFAPAHRLGNKSFALAHSWQDESRDAIKWASKTAPNEVFTCASLA
jgi:hypothetical protein